MTPASLSVHLPFKVITKRRRFAVTNSGSMGFCPSGSVPGDVIVVLADSPAPFVLRARPGSGLATLGDAYVHGIMDGEAIR